MKPQQGVGVKICIQTKKGNYRTKEQNRKDKLNDGSNKYPFLYLSGTLYSEHHICQNAGLSINFLYASERHSTDFSSKTETCHYER